MASLNSFDFTGRLGSDPELRSLPSGNQVCRLSVAVDTFGEKPTLWVDVSVWGKSAETCAQYLAKGREVAIHGQVDEVRAYTRRDGEPGASLSVSTRDVAFIGGRGDDDQGGGRRQAPQSDVAWSGDDFAPAQQPIPDDDIPF